MDDFEIEKYQPYSIMGKTCETREIREKRIVWPKIEKNILNNKYKIRMVRKVDVSQVADLWRKSYPELYGSSKSYDWIYYPNQYESKITFLEDWEDAGENKIHCMSIVEDLATNKIIAASLLTKDDRNLHVEYSLGCVDPMHRKEKTGESLMIIAFEHLKKIEDETDAEYMTSFCETWHSITQYLCFKQWGWKIAGIFPGNVTRWAEKNQEYRGCTVHFYKFLNNGENISTKPEEWELIPEVKKLWDYIEELNKYSTNVKMREYIEKYYD
jgi:hypothetical protein